MDGKGWVGHRVWRIVISRGCWVVLHGEREIVISSKDIGNDGRQCGGRRTPMKGEKWRNVVFAPLPTSFPSFCRIRFLRASSAQLFTTTTNRFILCSSAYTRSLSPGISLPSWLKQHPSREKTQKMRIHIFTAFLLVLNVAASHSSPLHSHARKSFHGVKRQLVSDLINGALDGLGLGGESARRYESLLSDLIFRWRQWQQRRR